MTILKGVATGISLFVAFLILDFLRMTRMAARIAGADGVSIDLRTYSSVVQYVAGVGLGILLGAGGLLALTKALEIHFRKLTTGG